MSIGGKVSIRPSTFISMEGGELIYEREPVVGGPIIRDPVKLKNTSVTFAVPIIIRLSDKNVAPFISMGPSFSYLVSQNNSTADRVPLKKTSLMGDAGIGVDIGLAKSRLVLSPEIKFTQGLNSIKDDAPGDYTTTLSSLKKRGITFSLYLRGR
jgi:Outer membrane protein beta-barrel domain